MKDPLADEVRDPRIEAYFGRCMALLVAARTHVREQRPERAVAIWRQLISEGGKDGDTARVDFAGYLFDEGREVEAERELAAVMATGRVHSSAWCNAAELLEEQGELEEALFWYSIATDRLTPEEIKGARRLEDLVTGRRRVKWALGVPLDDLDLLGQQGDDEAQDRESDLRWLLRNPVIIDGRMQVWDRGEFDAGVPWRSHFIGRDPDRYCYQAERALRAKDRRTIIATWTFDKFVDCLEDAKIEPDDIPGGRLIDWPPPRNKPCWCGSGLKYKRCCGGPIPVDEPVPEVGTFTRYRVAHGG